MRGIFPVALAVTAGLLATTSTAAAQERGKPRDEKPKAEAQAAAGFSDAERKTIAEYFGRNPYEAEALPPGIAKNIGRGKPLPPGIAKKQLPERLVAQLPKREGLEVTIFGDRIVLLEASGLVVDVIEGLFR